MRQRGHGGLLWDQQGIDGGKPVYLLAALGTLCQWFGRQIAFTIESFNYYGYTFQRDIYRSIKISISNGTVSPPTITSAM